LRKSKMVETNGDFVRINSVLARKKALVRFRNTKGFDDKRAECSKGF